MSPNTEHNRNELLKFVSLTEPKFLDGKVSLSGDRIHFASFPRSGNSFLRKYVEKITGVYTGSDFHIRDALPL